MRQKAIVTAIVALLIVGIAGSFWLTKSQTALAGVGNILTEELTKAVGTEVSLDKIEIAGFNKVVLTNVVVKDSRGELIGTSEQVTVGYNPLALIRGEAAVGAVSNVVLTRPQIYLNRRSDGKWNIDEILDQSRTDEASFHGKVTVKDGALSLAMPEGKWQLAALDAELDFVHKPRVDIALSARYGDSPLKVNGSIDNKGAGAIEVAADFLDLDGLKSLVPDQFTVKPVAGQVRNLDITLNRDNGVLSYAGKGRLGNVSVDIAGTPVRDATGEVAFSNKTLYLFNVSAKVLEQKVNVSGKIGTATADPVLNLAVTADSLDPKVFGPDIPVSGLLAVAASVSGTPSQLSASGEIKLQQGEVAGYGVQNAIAIFKLADNAVTIGKFEADMFGGHVLAAGTADIKTREIRVTLNGRSLDMSALPDASTIISGRGDVDLSIEGTAAAPLVRVSGTVAVTGGALYNIPFTSLKTAFYKSGSDVTVDYLTVNAGQGTLTAQGALSDNTVNLSFFAQGMPLAGLASAGGLELDGVADCSGTVTGTINNPTLTAKFTAYNGQAYRQPFTQASGAINVDQNTVTLQNIEAVNGSTRHKVQGTIGLTGEREVNLSIITRQARAENIVNLLLPGERLTGNVDNELVITGPLANFAATGKVKLTEGSFRGQLIARAEGEYRRQNGVTELRGFRIDSLNTQVKLDGTIDVNSQLDLTVVAKDIDVAALPFNYPYPITGRVDFDGKLTGTGVSPIFSGDIASGQLTLNGRQLQAITGKIAINGTDITVPYFNFAQGDGKYSFAGGINTESKAVFGGLEVANGSFASVLAILNLPDKNIDGRLDGQISLGGTISNPSISLVGKLTNGKIKNYPLESIDVDVVLDNKVVTVNKFSAKQGAGVLAVRGKAALDGPLNLEVGGRDIDAGLLTAWFDSSVETKGKLNFGAQVSGTTDKPHAAVSLEILGGGVANATFDALYGLFVLDNNSIFVNQLMLTKGPYRASAYGTVPLAALSKQGRANATAADQMDLKVRLEQANLSILPLLTKEVAWATGDTKGEVSITGTLAQPMLNGSILIKDGAIKLTSLADPIQKVAVDIQFEGDKINVKSFDGSMGSGNYRMTGTASWRGLALQDYNLLLVLDRLGVNHKYYKGPLNGTLVLANTHGKPTLSGKITLENTTVNIPFIPEFTSSNLDLGLDLELLLQNKVRLYNPYMYDIWVDGWVKFGGTVQSPAASGRLTAVRGSVNYLRTQFKINSGSADFTQFGSFIPVIRLNAETSLEHTKVDLLVNGPLNAMDFRLTSQPAMSQQEILSLLTLRSRYYDKQNSAGGSGLGRDELMGLLEAGMQMRFVSEMESTFRNYLGLDDFRLVRGTLTTDTDPKTGTTGTTSSSTSGALRDTTNTDREVYNLEIGKYITDRLYMSYTLGVDHNSQSAALRYDITRRISISGSIDELNRRRIGVETRFNF